jgi:ATP-dependent Lhr-like helicase
LLERWLPRPVPSTTERLASWADVLLERYGVLPREAIDAEAGVSFSSLYPILKAKEEAGKIRRGYFIADLSATQFALRGADDRLRLLRDPNPGAPAITLAATDPANPYGASLPWPPGELRPQRAAGARVFLREGALIGFLARSEQSLLTFLTGPASQRDAKLQALIGAVRRVVDGRARRALVIREIDGGSALKSPLREAFERSGFTATGDGLFCKGTLGDDGSNANDSRGAQGPGDGARLVSE